jgi:WhiB family redox-sensing transcriptional regulator
MEDYLKPAPWMAEGLCREVDGDLWFPEVGFSGKEAKRICRACPVREQCLALALEQGEQGIWGGTSERDRQRMRREAAA